MNAITFTDDEARTKSTEYFNGDELAAKVFIDKYALRNQKQQLIEDTPEKMHRRIAKEFARIESKKFKAPMTEDEIFKYLDRFKYIIPQGSPMYAIGNPHQFVSASNCFVVEPPMDSYGGILHTDEEIVQISKRRGGVGTDLSNLRPNGSSTSNASRTSTGIIPFMERYSNSCREVGQNGRRGAEMLTLSVHHPQIMDFIEIKNDPTKITGANISVRLTNEFLEAVKNDTEYELRWPVDSSEPKITEKKKAKEVWDEIVKSAHNRAEPGILFWDNIINESPADCYVENGFETKSTNPCAELPLASYDSCRLMVMNLYSFVKNPFSNNAEFDYDKLYEVSKITQRLMDDLIDIEIECIDKIIDKIRQDPEPEDIKRNEITLWKTIQKKCAEGRRTGTGITALGDTLAALGIKYGFKKSIETSEKIYQTIKLGSYRSSVDMAKEIGCFTHYDKDKEKNNDFIKRLFNDSKETGLDKELEADMHKFGRRNISLLTCSPTGSLSILAQTSSGVEPVFQLFYTRRKKINPNDSTSRVDFVDQSGDSWQEYPVFHSKLKTWMQVKGVEFDPDEKFNPELLEKTPWYECCAEDLNWKQRVKLQAAIQRHCDHSISSTVNLPEDTTVEQVKEIYETAWKSGCKGVTIYRNNCRSGVLVNNDKKEDVKDKNLNNFLTKTHAPKRPKELSCDVFHPTCKRQKHYVIVGLLEGHPYEVFTGINADYDGEIMIPKRITEGAVIKISRGQYILSHYNSKGEEETYKLTGTHTDDTVDSLTRMISTSLRHGVDISFIVHQLEKTQGDLASFNKVIARTLKKYASGQVHGESCPSCKKETLIRQDGCKLCSSCGYSACG